jgi:NADPH:quinone reductase-like Zn-dependent oxidoreductase
LVIVNECAMGRIRMKAAIYQKYGPPEVEHLAEVEAPDPQGDEILIKVHAATVNRTDCGHRRARPFFFRLFLGITKPKVQILGGEFAGEVVNVGPSVTKFKSGDRVFGMTTDGRRAHAQFVCLSETAPLATIPADISFNEAAGVCIGAIQALTCLRPQAPVKGQKILIYGASGSIGTAAVQLAKFHESHVTAVCNTKNLEIVKSLGADVTIDYTVEDFTKNGEQYDVIFDAVGKHSFLRCRNSLVRGGIFSVADMGYMWQNPFLGLATTIFRSKRVKLPFSSHSDPVDDVLLLQHLMETGKYQAVIDRCYPLEEVVEANRYVETEQKTGNVILTIAHDPS